jgi:hypothetical protein
MKRAPNNRAVSPPASSNTNQNRRDANGQWQRRYEHYRNLAQQTADRVMRETYSQNAEHYCRLMNGSA